MIQLQISTVKAILTRQPQGSSELQDLPQMCAMEKFSPHKAPECHRESAGAGPFPGKKSGTHLLHKIILYNPVHALILISRAIPNQHLLMEIGCSCSELLTHGTRKYRMSVMQLYFPKTKYSDWTLSSRLLWFNGYHLPPHMLLMVSHLIYFNSL